jgi:hypothetical protein
VNVVSYKKRTPEEILEMITAYEGGLRIADLCTKYAIGESAFFRLLALNRGYDPKASCEERRKDKVKSLHKKIKDQEEEIKLLRAALKKL